ncbi:ubiquitin carboxyl-terminal hydrolase family protein, partial [Trifolium pratense]
MENITGWMAPGSKDERRTNTGRTTVRSPTTAFGRGLEPLDARTRPELWTTRAPSPIVAQPEIANTVDRLHVKEPSPFRFTWRIDRFSQKKLKKKKVYSDVFEVGGSKWRLLIFPYGNNVDFLSVYLAVANSYSLPCDWSRHANFSMKVVNQYYYYLSKRKVMKHRFNERESDWGFRYFIPFDELYNPSRGYLVNDTLVVEVEVTCSVDEKEDEDLYTYIKVVQDEDLAEQIGNYIFFDLVDDEKVRSFRVQKKTTFYIFKEEVANEFGIPAQFLRFWLWEKRQNNTYRPSRPLTQIEEAGPVGQFNTVFLEVEHGPGFRLITPLNKRNDDILLFFKLYYPEKEELRYVGKLFVNRTDKPPEILTKLNKLAGYDPDEEINLFELTELSEPIVVQEIRFSPVVMCEPVDKKLTFQQSELRNGDIICFQKASAMDNVKLFRYPDVPSYLKYVSSRKIPFSSSDKESKDERSSAFSSSGKESKDEQSSEEQNKNIIDFQQTNCNENTDALESKVKIETIEKIDAMVDEDVIAAIDKVLSEWITISLQYQPSNGGQEKVSKLLQELRNIAFKEDLVKKFKEGLVVHEVNFNAVKEKIDANDDLFSSHQLEQVSVVVNLLNNIVRVFEKLEKLKKERDSAKKSIDQDKEALKETRQKILTSKTSFTNHQT